MKIYIKGTISTIIYNNESNGYTVGIFRIKETNSDDPSVKGSISFVGIFHELREKTNYIFYGNTKVHPKYGFQFEVNEYEVVKPSEKEDIISFLSSELFPIGEKTAEAIYKKLGDNAISKILDDKNVLVSIPRLKEGKINKIYEILKEYQDSNTIIIKMTELGFTLRQALSIYAKYKNSTLDIINDNIYMLLDSFDIPFMTIDDIALNMGIGSDDERRLLALIIYIISNICFSIGSTYVMYDEVMHELNKYVDNISDDEVEYLFIKLTRLGKLKIENGRYYLASFYNAEHYIAKRIYEINNEDKAYDVKKIEGYIKKLESDIGIKYDDKQKDAILTSIMNNFTVITGGPGTGKTTIIKCIVSILKDVLKVREEDIALLSPTGRASKRMSESVLMPCCTIHRYLKWDMDSNSFSVNEYNPSRESYIIVDEVSMVDTLLMESLLKGLKRDVKIILVGDYNQLPSVREGQVLKDIIDSGVVNVITLNSLYRQNENSYIVELAYSVKNRDISDDFALKKDDYNFIEVSSKDVNDVIVKLASLAIEKGYDDSRIQILAPMYKGECGIDVLNASLMELFNPPSYSKKEIRIGDITYRVGDKVLQLVNDTEDNVYNGDIGYVVDIVSSKHSSSKKNEIHVDFYGNTVVYTPSKFVNITHGYAISIHKSQGSEFDMVIMPIVKSFKRMLYNKLIYTGITRAKKSLILVGDKSSFLYGVNNNTFSSRRTSLVDLLVNMYSNKKSG